MVVEQCSNFLEKEHKHYIENNLLKTIDFVCQFGLVDEKDSAIGFSHCILARPEDSSYLDSAIIDPDNFDFMVLIFQNYLKAIGYNGNYSLLRIAINATTSAVSNKESAIHVDHNYDHKQLLIQLNDAFVGGGTLIYPKYPNTDESILIESKKYCGYSFDSCWHSALLPSKGVRLMAVYTYKVD